MQRKKTPQKQIRRKDNEKTNGTPIEPTNKKVEKMIDTKNYTFVIREFNEKWHICHAESYQSAFKSRVNQFNTIGDAVLFIKNNAPNSSVVFHNKDQLQYSNVTQRNPLKTHSSKLDDKVYKIAEAIYTHKITTGRGGGMPWNDVIAKDLDSTVEKYKGYALSAIEAYRSFQVIDIIEIDDKIFEAAMEMQKIINDIDPKFDPKVIKMMSDYVEKLNDIIKDIKKINALLKDVENKNLQLDEVNKEISNLM